MATARSSRSSFPSARCASPRAPSFPRSPAPPRCAWGLRDRWLTGRLAFGDFTLYAEGHSFRSDYGNVGFGREVDTGMTYAWGDHLVARLQHARYDPGAATPDASIRKTWLTVSLTY